MTTSFKKFRARGFRDKATDYNDAVRTTNIREKHKREGALAEKQNRENTSALLELRDIEDELQTLRTLFETQQVAINTMITHYESNEMSRFTGNALGFLYQAKVKLEEYLHHASKMIKSVQSTRDDVCSPLPFLVVLANNLLQFDKLLQMVQRQAQVDEVRLARLQADLASAQSRSVMIFTVFTVIFLPLTFFTGLFGMNTREWGGGTFLHLKTIGLVSIPASFVIITVALIIAWSTRMRRVFNAVALAIGRLLKWVKKLGSGVLNWISASTISDRDGRKRSIKEKKERKRAKKEAKKDASTLDEDFWEGHVSGQKKDYRLPPQNRWSVGIERRKMDLRGEEKGVGNNERWVKRR